MKSLRSCYYLLKFTYQDAAENFNKVFADIIITLARFGLLLWLYYYLFQYKGGTILDVDLATVSWSMFFYFSFMNINPRGITFYMQGIIKNGQIQDWLAKPINFYNYLFATYVGRRIFIFALITFFGSLCLYFIFGITANMNSYFFVFTLILTYFTCFVLSFLMYTWLGLLVFWIEDISPIRWIIDKFVMVLGGAFLPIAFFPPFMKTIAIYSPFGASQFVTHTVYADWTQNFPKLFLIQICWIIFFAALSYFTFKKVLKTVSLNGG